MARIIRSGLAVVALLLSLLVMPTLAGAAPAPGPGNSPNAKACQKGGYTTLVRSDGTTFASEEACTSYAAKGGTLYKRAAAPCLNGGYASQAPSEDNTTAFSSQEACVSYVTGGGTPVPLVTKPTLSITAKRQNPTEVRLTVTGYTLGDQFCYQPLDGDGTPTNIRSCVTPATEVFSFGEGNYPCTRAATFVVDNPRTGEIASVTNPGCS